MTFQTHLKELAKAIPFGIVLVMISTFGYLSDPVDNPHFGEDDASRFVGSVYTHTLKPINSMIEFVFDRSRIIQSSEQFIEYATGERLMGPGQTLNSYLYLILAWSLIGYLGSLLFILGKRHLNRPMYPSFWKISIVVIAAFVISTWAGSTWISYGETKARPRITDLR